MQVEYNASNYGARKRSNKKQADRDTVQADILAEIRESNAQIRGMRSPPRIEEDEVDLQMAAIVKKIKRNLDYVQQEDVMEELQAVVSRHVKQARGYQQYRNNNGVPTAAVGRATIPSGTDMGYMPQGPMALPGMDTNDGTYMGLLNSNN